MEPIYIIDTETCGLQGPVVELAYLKVDTQLNILDEFCARINPGKPIDPRATEIHGIRDEDVADCPTIEEVTKNFADPIIYVGHNCSFDQRMTYPHIRPKQDLCTLALARQYITGTTNNKLATLQVELGLPVQKSHSALGDVHTTRDLLLHIIKLTGLDMQTMLERANVPKLVAKIPHGPYKGITILRVPREERLKMLASDTIDKNLRFTLEKMKAI